MTEGEAEIPWLRFARGEKVPGLVARRILHTIVDDAMTVGDHLPPEAEMGAQLGVGRASLREALRILETHGLIRIKPGPKGGPVVTSTTAADFGRSSSAHLYRSGATLRDLIDARLVLEPRMASLAAENHDAASAGELEAIVRAGWNKLDAGHEHWSEAIESFHTVVARASGNGVLGLFSGALVSILRRDLAPYFVDRALRKPTLHIHDKIAEAILSRDAERAEDLSRRHVQALNDSWSRELGKKLDDVVEWR